MNRSYLREKVLINCLHGCKLINIMNYCVFVKNQSVKTHECSQSHTSLCLPFETKYTLYHLYVQMNLIVRLQQQLGMALAWPEGEQNYPTTTKRSFVEARLYQIGWRKRFAPALHWSCAKNTNCSSILALLQSSLMMQGLLSLCFCQAPKRLLPLTVLEADHLVWSRGEIPEL